MVGGCASPPISSSLSDSDPSYRALSDGKSSTMQVHIEWVHHDLFARLAVSR